MALFDQHLIVDWSANNGPKLGKDSIWACLVDRDCSPIIENHATRSQTMAWIRDVVDESIMMKKKLFIGFDFAFGYPDGTSRRLCGFPGWEGVWQILAGAVKDNKENESNRFEIAAAFNRERFADIDGPFWGHPPHLLGVHRGLRPTRPEYTDLAEKRIVEERVPSAQPTWKLAYPGSVGSQTLLGIKRLEFLRRRYAKKIAIWPFETEFSKKLRRPIVVAEVYPSLVEAKPLKGEVKDAAQVRVLAEYFSKLDAEDKFKPLLSAPAELTEEERQIIISEEGWIVGAPA